MSKALVFILVGGLLFFVATGCDIFFGDDSKSSNDQSESDHDDSIHDDGTHDDGTHDDGTHDDGTHDDGTHDDGTHDDGTHDDGTHDDSSNVGSGVVARVASGRAVAIGASGASAASLSLIGSGLVSSSVTNDSIFTIYEDGSMEPALEFPDGQRPEIVFTAVGPNGYLFVLVRTHEYWYWDEQSGDSDNLGLYAIDLETDEVFVASAGGINGNVKTWYWDNSTVRTRPIVFGADGRAYFVVTTRTRDGAEADRIASWMPGEQSVTFETIRIEGVQINRFQIDSFGRKYVSGYIYTPGLNGYYLQVFDPRTNRGRYVYLSDDDTGWVRGYLAVDDMVFLNGYNILGGYSGIVRLESTIVNGEIEFDQEVLYDNNSDSWFSPEYYSSYDDWSGRTIHRGLFSRVDDSWETWEWADYWKTDDGDLEEARILAYLSAFYVEDIWIDFSAHTAESTYTEAEIWGDDWNNWTWLSENVYCSEDNTDPATTFYQWRKDLNLPWLDFAEISDMNVLPDGSLWGIYRSWWDRNQPTVWLQLLDPEGNRVLHAITTQSANGSDVSASLVQFFGEEMFYRHPGDYGTHRIAAVNRDGDVRDITKNVPDIGFMTIYDYSVGGGILYLSGYDGINLVAGRIDLSTLEYTAVQTSTTITSIEALY